MKVISLFSGIGGLDLGLEWAGHGTIFANDIMPIACETYQHNFSNYRKCAILKPEEFNEKFKSDELPELPIVKGDIADVEAFPKADIVVGGFPCQGFSMIGTRLETDPRNKLYLQFSRTVSLVNPKYFIAENVRGLLQLYGGRVFEAIKEEFTHVGEYGYKVKSCLLNAKNYGVPQDRHRVIIVGVRNDIDFEYKYPKPTHMPPDFFGNVPEGLDDIVTLKDAIGSLPEPSESERYRGRFSPLYMSRNRKRGWDQVSFTIQANAMHVPLHPGSCDMVKVDTDKFEFNPPSGYHRRLTPKECTIIQSFPTDFLVKGSVQQQYKQIGNAVPPKLAEAVAKQLNEFKL